MDGVGLVAVLEHDVGVALIIERSVTDVLELEVYRQFGTGCHLVAVGSFNQLVAVTHLTVQLVEGAVVAPVIGGCLGVAALDKSPVESAHFGSRLLVRGPFFGQVEVCYIRLAAQRYIERLLCQIGFLCSRIGIRTHVVVVVEERIVVVSQTGFGSAGIGFCGGQRLCAIYVSGLELRCT